MQCVQIETVNGSYVLVSGVPVRNGQKHVKEICLLAVDILKQVSGMGIDTAMKIKIGIHTGEKDSMVSELN